jgi:hypothetical protein
VGNSTRIGEREPSRSCPTVSDVPAVYELYLVVIASYALKRGASAVHRGRVNAFERAWAIHEGIVEIHWTYDPLVRRNAYFNLHKLGAVPSAYLPDFYGPLPDGINAGDKSDRLYLRWSLASPRAVAAAHGDYAPRARLFWSIGCPAARGWAAVGWTAELRRWWRFRWMRRSCDRATQRWRRGGGTPYGTR